MQYIHPTAQIHPTALIGPNVTIGENTVVEAYCIIGAMPCEDASFDRNRESLPIEIGDNCIIHSMVRVDSPREGVTKVGNNTRLLSNSYVAHDSVIGNNVVMCPYSKTSGFCVLEDNVILGIGSTLHQRTIVRTGTILGAQSMGKGELLPKRKYAGVPAKDIGPNVRRA